MKSGRSDRVDYCAYRAAFCGLGRESHELLVDRMISGFVRSYYEVKGRLLQRESGQFAELGEFYEMAVKEEVAKGRKMMPYRKLVVGSILGGLHDGTREDLSKVRLLIAEQERLNAAMLADWDGRK